MYTVMNNVSSSLFLIFFRSLSTLECLQKGSYATGHVPPEHPPFHALISPLNHPLNKYIFILAQQKPLFQNQNSNSISDPQTPLKADPSVKINFPDQHTPKSQNFLSPPLQQLELHPFTCAHKNTVRNSPSAAKHIKLLYDPVEVLEVYLEALDPCFLV
jgi:hypothetical protein